MGKLEERSYKDPSPKTSRGTVLIFAASFEVLEDDVYEERKLRMLLVRSVKRLGFTLRKIASCDYKNPKNSWTFVGFLNESHIALTCYPEAKILEFEVASCKPIEVGSFVGWISRRPELKMISSFLLDKDEQGHWSRSI